MEGPQPLEEVKLEAIFSGMDPWKLNNDFTEISTSSGFIDLHNEVSVIGFRFIGHPRQDLLVDFKEDSGEFFSLEFQNVGELTFRQGGVASEGWPEIAEDVEPEGLDNISYYEYGTDIPPVFDISSLNLNLKFRSGRVCFVRPQDRR
ncbi:hypothetical protein ACFP3U_18335 [Kitasatospora misakiensis]|uniref:Uncharacterized protein n=1 Tax=Kitasatospora misakiensis TaxID=67330 RepID=A0ABW0X348_9ACTN